MSLNSRSPMHWLFRRKLRASFFHHSGGTRNLSKSTEPCFWVVCWVVEVAIFDGSVDLDRFVLGVVCWVVEVAIFDGSVDLDRFVLGVFIFRLDITRHFSERWLLSIAFCRFSVITIRTPPAGARVNPRRCSLTGLSSAKVSRYLDKIVARTSFISN